MDETYIKVKEKGYVTVKCGILKRYIFSITYECDEKQPKARKMKLSNGIRNIFHT